MRLSSAAPGLPRGGPGRSLGCGDERGRQDRRVSHGPAGGAPAGALRPRRGVRRAWPGQQAHLPASSSGGRAHRKGREAPSQVAEAHKPLLCRGPPARPPARHHLPCSLVRCHSRGNRDKKQPRATLRLAHPIQKRTGDDDQAPGSPKQGSTDHRLPHGEKVDVPPPPLKAPLPWGPPPSCPVPSTKT